jgi:hypothetical protein
MGYFIKREDSVLLKSFQLKPHHGSECGAELRMHASEPIVWYQVEGNWKILVAGQEAVRFANDNGK